MNASSILLDLAEIAGVIDEPFDRIWDSDSVTNFPTLTYSVRDVRRAGEALKGHIPWDTPENVAGALHIFEIANSWRDSHAYPMKRMRHELGGQLQRLKLRQSGVAVARLKRMLSIRRKLRRMAGNLTQIQDIGGCRVIVPSIDEVKRIIQYNRDNSEHAWVRDYPYIDKPKPDGYRCHHRIFKFEPKNEDETPFKDRRIEIQFRTRLQRSWATAVEAVGLFRSEDLKGGNGDPDWLRLFQLMSSELALAEKCPELEGAPLHKERVAEIKDINSRINADNVLEHLSQAFNYTEMYICEKAKYFLIEYDRKSGMVKVKPYTSSISGTKALDNIEAEIRLNSAMNAVLVEADKIEALKLAYPNYFGDVHVFKTNLQRITKGKEAVEFKLPPQQTVPPPPKEVPDTAWFRRPKFRKPKGA